MRIKTVVFFFLFVLIIIQILGGQAAASSPIFSEKLTSLGKIEDGFKVIPDSIRMSPDARHISYVAYTDKTHKYIFYDGKKSPAFYAVQPGMPFFSPKKSRHIFIAYKNKDGGAIAVVDGKPGRAYDNIGDFSFSAQDTRFSYRAVKNGKQCIVVDGIEGPWYNGIPIKNNKLFSSNSEHFAYVALTDTGCVLVLNGKEQRHHFKLITDVVFSKGGTRFAYKGLIEGSIDKNQKWCVVADGKKHNVYNRIFDIVFSSDSKHLAYSAVIGRDMVIVIDGKESKHKNQYGLPVFSKDSKYLAYSFRQSDKFYFLMDNEKHGPFENVAQFFYSPDSAQYAFLAKKNGKFHCIINGEIGHGYDNISAFKFSPDSSRYIYGAIPREDRVQVVVDGTPGKEYWSIGEPYFTPDSKHTIYRAMLDNAKLITIIDGNETENQYIGISPYVISEDSRHYACKAMLDLNHLVMIIDNKEYHRDGKYKIIGDPHFSPDNNHVVYHVQTGKNEWKLAVNGHFLTETYSGFMNDTPIIFESPTKFHTIALKLPGPEFFLIEVNIPDNVILETEFIIK